MCELVASASYHRVFSDISKQEVLIQYSTLTLRLARKIGKLRGLSKYLTKWSDLIMIMLHVFGLFAGRRLPFAYH